MNTPEIIDADGHVLESDAELCEYFEGTFSGDRSSAFSLFPSLDGWPRGARPNPAKIKRTNSQMWLEFLDRNRIQQAVLYPTAGLSLGLIQDPEWACAAARAYNNWLYDRYTNQSPRLRGVALLPVQAVAEAAAELRHAVKEQKMVAGLLPAVNILYKGYGHRDFYPIYEEAQNLDVPLAIHGAPSRGLGFDFLNTMAMVHTLEHPISQMIQLTSVVLDGILDVFPNLKIAFLEAGAGWIPYMMDRLDEKYHVDRKLKQFQLKKKPSEYIRSGNVYVTCELEEAILDTVVREFGENGLMYPSDFPHEKESDEFAHDIPDFLERPDLAASAKTKILAENAKRFYRL